MLTDQFPPDLGGVSSYVYNLSRSLVKRGHAVTVISRGSWRGSKYERVDGISVHRVRFIPSYPSPFWLQGVWVNKLFKSLESDFDLLHVHGALVPVIHTSLPIVFTSHGTIKKDIENMPARSFHFRVVKILKRQLFEAEKSLVRQADAITAVSKSCAEDLKGYHAIDKEITVIGNGIDSAFFAPNKANEMDETCILYTGRLETIKGLVTLVESAKYVCQKYKNLKYVLVGKGTIEKVLRTMISELGLEQNFHLAGYISDRNSLLQYYQKATIYVLPSYSEAMPTSLLEAMSCGIASIATDVGGNREVIADGETGVLVPSRDPKTLAEAILKLLDDIELRHKIGANARKHITNNYDWKLVVDRIEAIYSAVTGSKPGSG